MADPMTDPAKVRELIRSLELAAPAHQDAGQETTARLMQDVATTLRDMLGVVEWRPISEAPRGRFIILWCPEDRSVWWAKWQGGTWYGVDEHGLRRDSFAEGRVIAGYLPLPAPPKE